MSINSLRDATIENRSRPRRPTSSSVKALAALARITAECERLGITTTTTQHGSEQKLDDALVEARRKRNDRWLEERRVVLDNGVEHSNPASSRILSVR